MATVSAKDVQSLRQATGAGMLDCKLALEANDGDQEKAKQWLREKGLAGAAKRTDREASEGAVALAVEGGASIVELRSETDFVAKADNFVALVNELAQSVASKGTDAIADRADAIEELKITLKENISVGKVVYWEAVEGTVIGTYLHSQAGRGVNAVLVELRGGSEELAHDIAVHIAFARPQYLSREEVPQADIDAERATFETISRNEGKPEAALSKVVEGRLNGWFKERVLLDQPFAKDDKKSVSAILGGAEVLRFAQVAVGG
jgi:elongation factor Ts